LRRDVYAFDVIIASLAVSPLCSQSVPSRKTFLPPLFTADLGPLLGWERTSIKDDVRFDFVVP
jgi:hypothetical protein